MKKFFTLILAVMASVGIILAEGVQIGDLYYNLNFSNKTAEVTYQYDGSHDNYSNLKTVSIPSSVVCYDDTFSVTSIGERAFLYCKSLTSIEIPNSITSIGWAAFIECTSLPIIDNIRYADTYLVEAVNKSLSSYSIKEGTKWIGDKAFCTCTKLTSIEIPNSVISIGWYAFSWCEGLTFIEIPNSVTYLGDYAFEYCTALTSVNIGNGITKIGYYAFRNCSGLTNVIIGNNVTYIGHGAFEYCRSLTSIKIPKSVHNMGYDVFYYCTGLTSITSEAVTPPYLGDKVFYEVNKSIPLYVPAESITAYEAANQWKDFYNILALEEANEVVYDTSENQKLSSKLLRDNQILILRGEKTYTLTGQQVR